MAKRFLLALILGAILAGAALAQPHPVLKQKFQEKLEQLSEGLDGVPGVAIKDLRSGDVFLVNGDEVFPQASVIKVPLLVTLYERVHRGEIKLNRAIKLVPEQVVGGSGVLQELDDYRATLSVYDLAVLMITLSDNTATNILIDLVGMDAVNGLMDRLGLTHTRLQRKMMDIDAAKAGRENLSTPREMMTLLEILYRGEQLSRDVCEGALQVLRKPKRGDLRAGIPAGVPLANKTGGLFRIRNEVGLVQFEPNPYVIVVMTKLLADESEGSRFIQAVSRAAFSYFERTGTSNAYGRSFAR